MEREPCGRIACAHCLANGSRQVVHDYWRDRLNLAVDFIVRGRNIAGCHIRCLGGGSPKPKWPPKVFIDHMVEWTTSRQSHGFGGSGVTDIAISELIAKAGDRLDVSGLVQQLCSAQVGAIFSYACAR